MKMDYRCTEYDFFPSKQKIKKRKKSLLLEFSLKDDDNHYSYVSKRKSKANKLFRECYCNKCVYCGVPVEINSRRLFEVDHYICKTTVKENIKINHIYNLIVSSLVRNFVPRKKSKNHHAALNRISF